MILVDASAWVSHLRATEPHLQALLQDQQVSVHPMVIGELACGNLSNRAQVLGFLLGLPHTDVARCDEVLGFIERRRLMGLGIGYVDVHLLAAAAIGPATRLWTADTRLDGAASTLGLAYSPKEL